MALIQTDRDNVVRLADTLRSLGPTGRIGRRIVKASKYVVLSVRHRLASVAQWSTRRQARARLSLAEQARQRRALAQLSDRELRDIGLTRYDIAFMLRKSSRR